MYILKNFAEATNNGHRRKFVLALENLIFEAPNR